MGNLPQEERLKVSLEMKRFNGDLITMFQYLKCVTLVKEGGDFLSWFNGN